MKSKSRREIINELKDLRRENELLRLLRVSADMGKSNAEKTVAELRERLARLGNDHDLQYMKGTDNGTIISSVVVAPEHIEITGTAETSEVTATLARTLADAIIGKGLMRVEINPPNLPPSPFGVRVYGRVDVIPWDAICRRDRAELRIAYPPKITTTRRGDMIEMEMERGKAN